MSLTASEATGSPEEANAEGPISGDRLFPNLAKRPAKALRAAGKDAVGLFYYAGHGIQANGSNYLIPVGAQIDTEADLRIDAFSASDVLAQMEEAGNALNLVILDACRNNPFQGRFRSGSRGLARIEAASGSLIAFAAAPGQAAADGAEANSLSLPIIPSGAEICRFTMLCPPSAPVRQI